MHAYRLFRPTLIFFFLLGPLLSFAQQTQVYAAPDAAFRSALDLFEKQKYVEAQEEFDRIVRQSQDHNDLYVIDAQYYAALCSYELFHKDAEERLTGFLADHPESPKCARVRFQLARYNYRKKKYDDALAWFRQVEIYELQEDELPEFYFKRGYSHYEQGHIDSAKIDFFEIRDIGSKYSPPALYYYSHIAYTQGNNETALQGFLKLSGDAVFGPVVPYYIAQIYFLQGRYTEVINYAPPLLDSAKRAPEIAHLIGASYYRMGKYKDAVPYLQKHRAKTTTFNRHDAYELGYAYYKSDSVKDASELFQEAIADSTDALAQNAWYHLADCYLKSGNKLAARNSFGKASGMKFDPVIREDALFSYARLSYELSFSPFNEAIVALNQYLYEYPNTPRRDEAYTLLTDVYLSTKKYQQALDAIEKIKALSPKMQPVHQQIAFNRAIELYNNGDYEGAARHFDKSLTYPISRELNARAHYWKAESWYRKAETSRDTAYYSKAIAEYKVFQFTPGASLLPEFNNSNYNIGYCYFQAGQFLNANKQETAANKYYSNAMIAFRKYITGKTATDSDDRIFDAYLRLGDGYFRLKDFQNSSDYYAKAVAAPSSGNQYKDYALFQQAMALGYQGKSTEKAELMKKVRETYPNSGYLDNSKYQEARTWHDLREYDKALAAYNEIYKTHPEGPMAMLSLKNMGLIYRAKNDNDNALLYYKKAVELCKTQNSSEFPDLMRDIKAIYLSKGKLDEWETYAASVNYSESQNVADSTTYAVSQKLYAEGNCTEAMKQFNKYIQKYPAGNYITDVQYMRAECANRNADALTAIEAYSAVLAKGQSRYTERSLIQIALLYYKQKDYANAAQAYGRIERELPNTDVKNNARVNLMRCWVNLNNNDSAAVYAAKVLAIKNLPNDVTGQANYLMGKSSLAKADKTAAEKYFKKAEDLLPQSEFAAECRYHLCWIKYDNKEYKAAEKALLKQINDYAGYSYWSGKGWLLLADDYLALKDTFQAKYVLNSYIENGDVPELQQLAKEKLNAIEAAHHPSNLRKEEDIILPPPGEGTQPGETDNGNGGGK